MTNGKGTEKLASKLSGRFIVLDGPDGCGKSTQSRLLAERLAGAGVGVVSVRDPGGTAIGDSIRRILLGNDHEEREVRCELLLFMASRAQLVAAKIKPALAEGRTVLCDRYVSSSCAYQGAAGLEVEAILSVARFAAQETWPDLTVVLDVPPEVGLARIAAHRDGEHDVLERRGLAYHRKVREIFLNLPRVYPAPVVVVDATDPVETVQARVEEVLARVDY